MGIQKTDKIKNGKQQYKVQVNYTDIHGNYRNTTRLVYGMSEARTVESQLLTQLDRNNGSCMLTVFELFNEYIKSKKHEVRATSLDKSTRILNRYVIPYFKNIRIDKLTTQNLQTWKNEINEKPLSVVTKQNIYTEFRTMLYFAVKMEYLNKNPLTNIGNFKEIVFSKPQDKLQYYTAEEFKRYIEVAKDNCKTLTDYGYYVFFNIAYYTGARKGEINALKWSDIEGNVMHIRRSVAQKIKGSPLIETSPKNRSSYRDVQMPHKLVEILKEHKERQRATKGFSDDFRVCGGVSCLRDSSIGNRNSLFAQEADLHHIRIHDFRHSHASLLVNSGINIQEVARRLGHSDIKMTWNTYSHLYPREEERALKILEEI